MSDGDVQDIKDRLTRLEDKFDAITLRVAELTASASTLKMILTYVVTPLIIVVAGLVGIKLVNP